MKDFYKNTTDTELLFSKHHLLQLLWPLVVEQLLAVLVGMVDVLMVAYVGEATVSGVSLVDMIFILFINIFSLNSAAVNN